MVEQNYGWSCIKMKGPKSSPPPLVADISERISLKSAINIMREVVTFLQPHITKYAFAGSVRRGRESIGDGDIIFIPKNDSWFDSLLAHPAVKVLESGKKKASILVYGFQVDLLSTTKESWGAALQYFTGSKWHNISLRVYAKKLGFTVNEYGVFNNSGMKIAGETERGVYRALGLKWWPPKYREGYAHFAHSERAQRQGGG